MNPNAEPELFVLGNDEYPGAACGYGFGLD